MGAHEWWTELRRRNVLRAAILYVGAVWALAQGIAQLAPVVGASDSAARWFLIAAAVGFPFWLLLAWRYELTTGGLKREDELAPDRPASRTGNRRTDIAIICVLSIAVVLLLVNQFALHRQPSTAQAGAEDARRSIAVLPFQNLSGSRDSDYFASGIQDLILTSLSGIRGLRVTARASTENYKPDNDDFRKIADELGAQSLLKGSVQRHGNDVLITAQLIDARTGAHLWAASYRRTLDDIFGVEGEVAASIAQALKTRISPSESSELSNAPTHDKSAYDIFLRAEFLARQGVRDNDVAPLLKAIPLYREAVEHDSGFALALARLSYAESWLAWFGGGGTDTAQLQSRAQIDAERALQLDSALAPAQLALGYSENWGRQNVEAAKHAFAKALELQPDYVDALAAQADMSRREGDYDAAVATLKRALTLDPRNTRLYSSLGITYMMHGDYAAAEAPFRKSLALDPDNLNARSFYSYAILFASGDVEAALKPLQGESAFMTLQRVALLTYMRRYSEALAEVEAVPDTPENFSPGLSSPKSLQLADIHFQTGDQATARRLYQQALQELHGQLQGQQDTLLAFTWGNIARVEAHLDHPEAALAAVAKSKEIIAKSNDPVNAVYPALLNAMACAEMGRADLAVPMLQALFADPSIALAYAPVMLQLDPTWNAIRGDARFQALLRTLAPPIAGAATAANT